MNKALFIAAEAVTEPPVVEEPVKAEKPKKAPKVVVADAE